MLYTNEVVASKLYQSNGSLCLAKVFIMFSDKQKKQTTNRKIRIMYLFEWEWYFLSSINKWLMVSSGHMVKWVIPTRREKNKYRLNIMPLTAFIAIQEFSYQQKQSAAIWQCRNNRLRFNRKSTVMPCEEVRKHMYSTVSYTYWNKYWFRQRLVISSYLQDDVMWWYWSEKEN